MKTIDEITDALELRISTLSDMIYILNDEDQLRMHYKTQDELITFLDWIREK